MNARIAVPAFASALLVLVALADHSGYDYYMVMRWVATVSAAFIAYVAYNDGRQMWPWVFVGVAILFNPLAMITMDKEAWAPIDVAVGALFGAAPFVLREPQPAE